MSQGLMRWRHLSCLISEHYRDLLMAAAGGGFISIRRRTRRVRVIEGALRRGFRWPRLDAKPNGEIAFSAWYGTHRVSRWFARNADGSIPDNDILAALHVTADRMDARHRIGKRKRIKTTGRCPATSHWIYGGHGKQHAGLEELVQMLPPRGGMAAYVRDMSEGE
jgi:hypothetical protein